jgi:hypothetical protein
MTDVPAPDAGGLDAALVAEATRRSGVVWLSSVGAAHRHLAWHIWLDDAAYVVHEGAEQRLDVLERADGQVVVTVPSKDKGSRLVSWVAAVETVEPGTQEWETAAAPLHAARLNAPDGEQQPARWARESVITRLRPTGDVPEAPERMPSGEQAEPVRRPRFPDHTEG